jgi:hypothetical protein
MNDFPNETQVMKKLIEACGQGQIEVVQTLLNKRSPLPLALDQVGFLSKQKRHVRQTTALIEAAKNGHLKVCELLIENAELDTFKLDVGPQRGKLGDEIITTPLIEAAKGGYYTVCELLLTKKRINMMKMKLDLLCMKLVKLEKQPLFGYC